MKYSSYLVDGNTISKGRKNRTLFGRMKDLLRPLHRFGLHSIIHGVRVLRGDPHRVIYVDPNQITHTVNANDRTLKRNDMWHFGSVSDGDWDQGGIPIDKYGFVLPILRQRTIDGLEFDQIPEFQENLRRIARGERVDVCSTKEQYLRKWQHIEFLYKLIKENGYRSQKDLRSGRPFNEIRIQIGRDGGFLFEEGLHRLIIAKVLKLDRIPVIITRRHSNSEKANEIVKRTTDEK